MLLKLATRRGITVKGRESRNKSWIGVRIEERGARKANSRWSIAQSREALSFATSLGVLHDKTQGDMREK